jgi:hypothetical protein
MGMNAPFRPDRWCIHLATWSFPVPDSPTSENGSGTGAMRSSSASRSRIGRLSPIGAGGVTSGITRLYRSKANGERL